MVKAGFNGFGVQVKPEIKKPYLILTKKNKKFIEVHGHLKVGR